MLENARDFSAKANRRWEKDVDDDAKRESIRFKMQHETACWVFAFWLGHCANANWRLRLVRCFCDWYASLYGGGIPRSNSMSKRFDVQGKREQAGKMLVRRPWACCLAHRGGRTSSSREITSVQSPITNLSYIREVCSWHGWSMHLPSVSRVNARCPKGDSQRTGKLIRSNWFLHPRDLRDFSLVGESWLKTRWWKFRYWTRI